jgi:hypothetical protein
MIRSEDDLHLLIGNYLNINELNLKKKGLIYWTYSPAGELRNKLVAIKLKRKGVKKGDADYRLEFVKNDIQYIGYFEIKFGKNKLTKDQKQIFEIRSKIKNTKCYTCYSFEEFEDSLNNFLEFIEFNIKKIR